jgi:hypothetical protein
VDGFKPHQSSADVADFTAEEFETFQHNFSWQAVFVVVFLLKATG